jgi:hypothetical protein
MRLWVLGREGNCEWMMWKHVIWSLYWEVISAYFISMGELCSGKLIPMEKKSKVWGEAELHSIIDPSHTFRPASHASYVALVSTWA